MFRLRSRFGNDRYGEFASKATAMKKAKAIAAARIEHVQIIDGESGKQWLMSPDGEIELIDKGWSSENPIGLSLRKGMDGKLTVENPPSDPLDRFSDLQKQGFMKRKKEKTRYTVEVIYHDAEGNETDRDYAEWFDTLAQAKLHVARVKSKTLHTPHTLIRLLSRDDNGHYEVIKSIQNPAVSQAQLRLAHAVVAKGKAIGTMGYEYAKELVDASAGEIEGLPDRIGRAAGRIERANPLSDTERKKLNVRLSDLTARGYDVRINHPYIKIQDDEGREWTGEVDTANDLIDTILAFELTKKASKKRKR